jgi:hypothetical protein
LLQTDVEHLLVDLGQPGAGNNWAKGHYTEGAELARARPRCCPRGGRAIRLACRACQINHSECLNQPSSLASNRSSSVYR